VRTVAALALVLVAGSAVAFALGAFRSRSPSTSHVTGVYQLPQPWLGLTTTSSPSGAGALVTQIAPGGPADQAGLQRGDLITAVDGQAITRPAEMTSVVDSQQVGTEILLQIDRGGQLETVGVIVASRWGMSP
jgi:putative serine protease PepD